MRLKFTPLVVSIEGNIGAGKSTLLTALRTRNVDWTFVAEPVDKWSSLTNEKNLSLLEVFYKDRKRWSYTFQNYALLTRYDMMADTIESMSARGLVGKQVCITERCLDTDFEVFTKMLKDEGSIDKLEFDLYLKWYQHLRKLSAPLSAMVHLSTPPATCEQRIRMRQRSGEENISLDYLKALDKYQSAWVNNTHLPSCQVASTDIDKVEQFINTFLNNEY